MASLSSGGEEALLLPPPNGRRRQPLYEEVSVDVSGSNFDRMAELRRYGLLASVPVDTY